MKQATAQLRCRDCRHVGDDVVPSLVPGEGVCASWHACQERIRSAARARDFGGWGEKWPKGKPS